MDVYTTQKKECEACEAQMVPKRTGHENPEAMKNFLCRVVSSTES